jgi:predicted ABC-type ATPase
MSFESLIASEMLEEARSLLDISLAVPMKNPFLVILGGQPGSGKSSVIEMIEARFDDNIISINGDDVVERYQNQRNYLNQEQYEQMNASLNEVLQLMKTRNALPDEIQNVINLQVEFQNYYTNKINEE